MKKNLIIGFLLLLSTWLSLLTIKFYTETQKGEDKITISSNCNNGWKKWENKTYGFSLCMPDDWKGISVYSGTLVDLYDDVEKVGNDLTSKIGISTNTPINYKKKPFYEDYFYYSKMLGVNENIDFFKTENLNNLKYDFSIFFLNTDNKVISFYYNKHEEVHKKVIDSIRELK